MAYFYAVHIVIKFFIILHIVLESEDQVLEREKLIQIHIFSFIGI